MPAPVAYIAELVTPSAALVDKIHRKHNVTLDEVHEAVILTDVERSAWNWDPEPSRGWRLIVIGTTYAGVADCLSCSTRSTRSTAVGGWGPRCQTRRQAVRADRWSQEEDDAIRER